MKRLALATVIGAVTALVLTSSAQQGRSVNWPLHNLDLAGSRFSTLDQINTSNVKTLTPRWLFQHGVIDGVSNQTTPVIVDGVMYVTDSRGSVYARRRGRRPSAVDLRRHQPDRRRARARATSSATAASPTPTASSTRPAGSFLFALDAKTGKPIPGFGKNGQASVILDVLKQRYPDVKTAISLGYWFTTAPQVHNGVIYIGSTRSESHIPGGHVLAVDAKTGKVLWHFNTIPQDEKDQGWEIAGPTWVGGERNGGGIWETPSIDPELGLLYVAVGNPFGDSTKRAGIEPVHRFDHRARRSNTGKLEVVLPADPPRRVGLRLGQPADPLRHAGARAARQGLAEASKNGYLYILNRETGQPVHPIKEMPVPTETARPGEQPWPTQPIPFTAAGKPMSPVSPGVPGGHPGRAPGEEQAGAASSRRRARTDHRARHRAAAPTTGRCPTARGPGCSTSTRSTSPLNSGRPARGLLLGVRSDDRRAGVAEDLRRLRPGRIGRHRQRSGVRRHRQQRRRLLLRLRREDRRAAVEVQHRSRRLLVAVGLHGERRAVRDRGVGRRRAGRRGGDLILSFALPDTR